ncbi:sulfurtransferase FdhD [bacterium]|nr:MAG: sulfurtransferase FdhD [bacterium]
MTPSQSFTVQQIRGDNSKEVEDDLVVEEPLEIRLDNRRYTATMRTPGATPTDDLLLAQGLLFTEGVITELEDIERMEATTRCRDLNGELVNIVNATLHDSSKVPEQLWERSLISNSSCGLCGKATVEALSSRVSPLEKVSLDIEVIRTLPEKMRPHQKLFDRTGGCHAAAIFDAQGELLCCFEDIGRHNATDKAIGYGLENYFVPAAKPLILLVSGRASFEIIQKALVARIQTVCSVSAASSLAVDLARANNMNLIGFLRPSGLTVY